VHDFPTARRPAHAHFTLNAAARLILYSATDGMPTRISTWESGGPAYGRVNLDTPDGLTRRAGVKTG